MKRVVLCSPWRGDEGLHREYLMACIRDSFSRGEAPYAAHAIGPLVLDEDIPEERRQGIASGIAWLCKADLVAVYLDLGEPSEGMREEMKAARWAGIPVEERRLGGPWAPEARIEAELRAQLGGVLDLAMAAVSKWGPRVQTAKAVEELGELVTAIGRLLQAEAGHRHGRVTPEEIAQEAADVIVTAVQVGLICAGPKRLADALDLDRLQDALEGEEPDCPTCTDHGPFFVGGQAQDSCICCADDFYAEEKR